MRRNTLFVLLLAATAALAQRTPTMGWSSWNTFALNINEDLIKQQADAMHNTGLQQAGYQFVNIDDGYWDGRGEDGKLRLNMKLFPSGMRSLVDYIHSLGLKAGIYSDAGDNTCGSGNRHAWGIGVGFAGHEEEDCKLYFRDWDFDFIKVDYCGGAHMHLDEQQQYTKISNAIKNCGKPGIVYNMCRWAYPGTWSSEVADSWRTTGDIYDAWKSVKGILAENLYMSAYCSKGHYNDMDMLEVGRSMTEEEDKTHFGMWCIMNSPLLIGCNLATIKTAALKLLKNTELIALNQDTLYQQAYVAGFADGCHLLVRDIERWNGNRRAFAVYNPNDEARTFTVNFRDIDLGGEVKLRDVFQNKDVGAFTDSYEVALPAHGTRIYVAEAETRLERVRYEAETGYSNAYSEIEWNVCQYSAADFCSGGYKAGYLGQSDKNDLQWRNVYSQEGGDYKLTIGYLCGESRNITISVNGKRIKNLSFNSGGFDKVGRKSLDIQLQPGQNTIRLSNTSGWMPDIDYIDVEPIVPAAVTAPAADPRTTTTTTYDLQGRPVTAATPRGIVITSGRKVLR